MKLFITGATGFIGQSLIPELQSHNHEVYALSRTSKSTELLKSQNVHPITGDLENLEALIEGVKISDGVIHLGFVPDFANYERSCRIDREAVDTMMSIMQNTGKVFVYTTGVMGLKTPIGVQANENDLPPLGQSGFGLRFDTEVHVMESAEKLGIRSMIVRLPPTVHGDGDVAFIPKLFEIAKAKGKSYFVNGGDNTWPAVHKLDVVELYRLAAEKGKPGKAYHACAEEAIPFKEIASVIAKKFALQLDTFQGDLEDVLKEFGGFGLVMFENMNISSKLTKEDLGWKPNHVGLIDDIWRNYSEMSESHMKF